MQGNPETNASGNPVQSAHGPDTADRLRSDIDSGRTGEKIAFPDPAAAPLGTDDEAAGTPVSPSQVRAARKYEARTRPAPPARDLGVPIYVALVGAASLALLAIVGSTG